MWEEEFWIGEMAGSASEESGAGRSVEGISSGQRCQSGEALAEWRSSEQVENGTPSTSPPYWDTDDDDDGCMVLFPPTLTFFKYYCACFLYFLEVTAETDLILVIMLKSGRSSKKYEKMRNHKILEVICQ